MSENNDVDETLGPPAANSTAISQRGPANASPRAGGYVKGLPPSGNVISSQSSKSMEQSQSRTSMSVFYAKSRDHRINLVLEDSEWDLGEDLDICGGGGRADTLADNMLAVTISCVMLMATDVEDIPEEYLVFAENYLSCIKDDTDYHPPNIQGLLNHIAYLRDTTNRTRDRTKETCKCADNTDDDQCCNSKECAKRSISRVKFKKEQSANKSSRCRIPVRRKSCSSAK